MRRAGRAGFAGAGSRRASLLIIFEIYGHNRIFRARSPRPLERPRGERGGSSSSQSRERRARIGGVMRLRDGAPDMRVAQATMQHDVAGAPPG